MHVTFNTSVTVVEAELTDEEKKVLLSMAWNADRQIKLHETDDYVVYLNVGVSSPSTVSVEPKVSYGSYRAVTFKTMEEALFYLRTAPSIKKEKFKMDVEKEVERAVALADTELERLAELYRQEILIPLCKKKKMRFMSGNGTFIFYNAEGTKDWQVGANYEAINLKKRYLIPILEDLNQEVSHGQYFGYYVCDVDTKDIK